MNLRRTAVAALFGCALFANPASAAINASKLGASYDATKANVTFKVYSGRATRIELYLFSTATGTAEKSRVVMTLGTGGVWSATIPVTTLNSQGLTGTLYYGYRAWGPNWPYSTSWTKGSATGFITDVDANGNRLRAHLVHSGHRQRHGREHRRICRSRTLCQGARTGGHGLVVVDDSRERSGRRQRDCRRGLVVAG
jgi:pullulanase/glycogen debranching enzyme